MAPRGRPRGIAWQQVERLAEAGVLLEDIVLALDLPSAAVKRDQARLDNVVARGHARFRAAIAKRLHREGVYKGRAHSLLGLARLHLGLDSRQPPDTGPEVLADIRGAGERLMVLIDKARRNMREREEA